MRTGPFRIPSQGLCQAREARETLKRREGVVRGDGTGGKGRFSYGNRNEGKSDMSALFVFLLCLLCQNHGFSPACLLSSHPSSWGTTYSGLNYDRGKTMKSSQSEMSLHE